MGKITLRVKTILVIITFLGFTNFILSENNFQLENFLEKNFSPKESSPIPASETLTSEAEEIIIPKKTNTSNENTKEVFAQPVITLPSSTISVCENTGTASLNYSATNQPDTYSIRYNNSAFTDVSNANIITGAIPLIIPQNMAPGTYTGIFEVTNSTDTSNPVSFSIIIKPTPRVNSINNITACTNGSISAIQFSGNLDGANYQWTNSNPAIGLAASGTGIITSFTATNNSTSTISSEVTVTASGNDCTGVPTSFTITVHPEPTITKPGNLIVCNNSSVSIINFTGNNVSGKTYKWVNDTPSIGLAESGTGNSPSFTAVNTTASPVTAQITVTPVANNCDGPPQTFSITVNPTPRVDEIPDIVACSNTQISQINFGGSNVAGTTYRWTNSNSSIGIQSTGTGNITAFQAVNISNSPITANITVTPVANNCEGPSKIFKITVNPIPSVTKPTDKVVCNNGVVDAIGFPVGSISGTTYKWVNNTPSIGLAENGTGTIPSFTATNTTGLPVTAQITVTPVANNCEGNPQTFTIRVNPTPGVNDIANIVVCNNTQISQINFGGSSVASTSYKWTNSNSSIGIASTGTGNITAFTAVNTTNSPVTSNITVTPVANNCEGSPKTFTITVNPIPSVTKPADIVICNNGVVAAIGFPVGSISGTTYQWVNDTPSIGLAANGTGTIPSFTATNTTAAPVTAQVTVTPVANNCEGTSQTFTIKVNPTPGLNDTPNIVACNNTAISEIIFGGSSVSGTSYKWANSTASIGLASSGTGNILAFTAKNTSNSPVTSTITVTPVANNCEGTPKTFSITVNPTPSVTKPTNIVVCDKGTVVVPQLSGSSISGTTYNWANDNPSIGLVASGVGNISSFTATNTTSTPQIANITVSPVANSCEGTSQPFTITVNPTATVNKPANVIACKGEILSGITFSGNNVTGTTYKWTNDNPSIGLSTTGNGNIPSFTASNNTSQPITANLKVTPVANGCEGTPEVFTIIVNPETSVNLQDDIFACNEESLPATVFSGSSVSGTVYNWTNDNPSIGIPASGTGDLPAFVAINNTNEILVAKITLTPEANGCEGATREFDIIVFPAIFIDAPDITVTPVGCMGDMDGIITIGQVFGGNGTYLFSIDAQNFGSSKTFTGLGEGYHTIYIKDTQRCSFETEIYVGQPDEISMQEPAFTPPSCFGASDGTITAGVVTGGNGDYTYSLDNINYTSENTFTGVNAGSHTIFVKDNKGCSLQRQVTVTAPKVLSATVTRTNVSCFEGNDGKITITNPTGGSGFFEFSIDGSNWQTSGNFTGLTSGVFSVQIRDKNAQSCIITLQQNYQITQPSIALSVEVITTRTLAFGSATGTATANPAGGTSGYTYEWRKQGQSSILYETKIVNNLAAGNYVVTVIDKNGCKVEKNLTIIDKVQANIISASECFSVHDMIRTSTFRVDMINVKGGVGTKQNFIYEWNFGSTAIPQTATGQGPFVVKYQNSGDKDIILWVTDEANVKTEIIFPHYVGGCFEGCGSTSNFEINVNNYFIGDANGNPLTGEACETTAEKFLWIDITKNANGYSLSAELNYSVSDGVTTTARKAIGCFAEIISGVPGGNGNNSPTYAPIPLGLFKLFPVQSTGDAGDKLIWKCGETFNVEQINIRWTNQETRGCNEGTKPMCYGPSDEVEVITPILANAVPQHVLCKGESTGTLIITAAGGTRPYQYSINGENGNYKATNEFYNLPAGVYSGIWVRDSRGRKVSVVPVTILEPDSKVIATVEDKLLLCFGETTDVTVSAAGGTPPYTYLWNDSEEQTGETAINLVAGNYTVTVIDANGCQDLETFSITQPEQLTIAEAGLDQSFSCGFSSTLLNANTPDKGVGTWSIISGTGGTIVEVNNPKSRFNGGADSYTLRWTIAHADGTCSSYSDVEVSFTEDCSTLDFDGVDDHIVFGNNYGISTGPFTIEAWVKLNSLNGVKTVFSKRNASNLGQGGYDLVINNGAPTFRLNNTAISTSSKLATDRWYHISVIFNNSKAEIYVDGLNVGNGAATSPIINEYPFIIGAMNDNITPTVPKNYFHGWIEEVRIWNRALTLEQLRFMMNQRIEISGTGVKGTVLPMNVPSNLTWNSLLGYYRLMTNEVDNGWTKDRANTKVDGYLKNIETLQQNTAPLPYISAANGTWRDQNNWAQPVVWDPPNSLGINGEPINWNIASISHDLKSGGKNLTLLGLLSESGELEMANPNETIDENNAGQGLFITHYLKLNGFIDLVGESQLVQTDISQTQTIASILEETSSGYITRDQQGTANSYNYNYWSSPVSLQNAANNSTYTIAGVMKDGTNSANETHPNLTFGDWHGFADGAQSNPRKVSNYWLHKFRGTANVYSEWVHIGSTGILNAGEGYTMKGTSGNAAITDRQNYVFKGKPNNGVINLTISTGQNYLLGNPYPSSIDVNEFIMDNLKDVAGGRNTQNVFNGTVYFWDHFAGGNTHILLEYIGGYAARNLLGGVPAISNDDRVNANNANGSKIPGKFIPVAQGFFINSSLEQEVAGSITVDGGDVIFRNGQRAFVRESKTNTGNSVFLRPEENTRLTEKTDTRPKIRIDFRSPMGYNRQILAGADVNTTNGFDLGYDAPLNDNNAEDMFWMIGDHKYVIQGVPDFNLDQVLKLGVRIKEEGKISIRINDLENIHGKVNIFLKDKEEKTFHNLRKSDFTIIMKPGSFHDRFEIVFQITNEWDNPEEEEEEEEEEGEEDNEQGEKPGLEENLEKDPETGSPQVFYIDNSRELLVRNPELHEISKIVLHSLSGQVIEEYINISTQKEIKLPVRSYSSSVYAVKMLTNKGVIYKKIIINN